MVVYSTVCLLGRLGHLQSTSPENKVCVCWGGEFWPNSSQSVLEQTYCHLVEYRTCSTAASIKFCKKKSYPPTVKYNKKIRRIINCGNVFFRFLMKKSYCRKVSQYEEHYRVFNLCCMQYYKFIFATSHLILHTLVFGAGFAFFLTVCCCISNGLLIVQDAASTHPFIVIRFSH